MTTYDPGQGALLPDVAATTSGNTASTLDWQEDSYTLTSLTIANGIDLSFPVADEESLRVSALSLGIFLTEQEFSYDSNVNTITFSLDLQNRLQPGDQISVKYLRST